LDDLKGKDCLNTSRDLPIIEGFPSAKGSQMLSDIKDSSHDDIISNADILSWFKLSLLLKDCGMSKYFNKITKQTLKFSLDFKALCKIIEDTRVLLYPNTSTTEAFISFCENVNMLY